MPYVVGVSFSNVQNSFNSATNFVGFAVESGKRNDLRIIKTKESLFENVISRNPFDLSPVENEIRKFKDFTVKGEVIKLAKKERSMFDSELSFILCGLLKAIESTKSANLHISSEGLKICFLHVPLDSTGKKELDVENFSYFDNPISKYEIKFQKKGDFEPILELARLGAWLEYLKMLRGKTPFINKQITENANLQFLQFCRISWNSPPIESYSDNFVGYPRMLFKTMDGMTDILIRPQRELDFLPIVRACSGTGDGFNVPRCKSSSARKPFGNLLMKDGFEKCKICSQTSMGPRCLWQRAQCDGLKMDCKDRKFISTVCHDEFCIYLTLFGNRLKVGRGLESRIIGRLLEQCAYDAIIFYPVPWLPLADHLEISLTQLLKEQLSRIRINDVKEVSERVTYQERLGNIVSVNKNVLARSQREKVYNQLIDVLASSNTPESNYLLALQRRIVCFEKNWIVRKTTDFNQNLLVRDIKFVRIRGRVTGVIGSFVITDNLIYDTSAVEGYIIGFPKN